MKNIVITLTLILINIISHAQITTGEIFGRVVDDNDKNLVEVTIEIVNNENGYRYTSKSNSKGYYRISNISPSENYQITISKKGYLPNLQKDISISVGDRKRYNITLSDDKIVSEEIFNNYSTLTNSEIEKTPTLSRNINSYLSMFPQLKIDRGDEGISANGQNGYSNKVSIDGVLNNDIFGSTKIGNYKSAISIENISQISLLKFSDVRNGERAGANIVAISKSGANNFSASAYSYLSNNSNSDSYLSQREHNSTMYGVTLSGALRKNRLFYYVNAELQLDNNSNINNLSENRYVSDIENIHKSVQGRDKGEYNAGSYEDNNNRYQNSKIFMRMDCNISEKSKISVTNSTSLNKKIDTDISTYDYLLFENSGSISKTDINSSTFELFSNISPAKSNHLFISFNAINNSREHRGELYPTVVIEKEKIIFGSNPNSINNTLNQRILTLSNNTTINRGKHSFTFGTYNQLYLSSYVNTPNSFGTYFFNNANDFIYDKGAISYSRNLYLDSKGLNYTPKLNYNNLELSIYAQDIFQINKNLSLSYGVRIELPIALSSPVNKSVDSVKINPNILPHISFDWMTLSNKLHIYGGVNMLSGTLPYINIINSTIYNNSIKRTISQSGNIDFQYDLDNQYLVSDNNIGYIEIIDKELKSHSWLKANLNFDFNVIKSGNINLSVSYQNALNSNIIHTYSDEELDMSYITNSSSVSSTNVTLSFRNNFDFGLSTFIAYNYNIAKEPENNLPLGVNNMIISNNSSGSRISAALSYNYSNTTLSLLYEGLNSRRYSYLTDNGTKNGTPLYVPFNKDDIALVSTIFDGSSYSPDEQWEDLNSFIESNPNLSDSRGNVVGRNEFTTPWENIINLKIIQTIRFSKKHKVEIFLSIDNISNLLNKNWGTIFYSQKDIVVLNSKELGEDNSTPKYSVNKNNLNRLSKNISEWRGQIGLKYIF